MFRKKCVLKNFVKLTRKHQCQSLCLNKVAGLMALFFTFYDETFCIYFTETLVVYQKQGLLFKKVRIFNSSNSVEFLDFL